MDGQIFKWTWNYVIIIWVVDYFSWELQGRRSIEGYKSTEGDVF